VGRTRTLTNLIADVRKRADVEGATARHPDADLTRYINQGGAALRDLLIEVRGRRYFRSTTPISVTAGTSVYGLPPDFQSLLMVRISTAPGQMLEPLMPEDEAWMRDAQSSTQRPTHYDLKAGNLEFLPVPTSAMTVTVDYIAAYADLVAGSDTLDGFDGWEEYVVSFAAKCVGVKDDEQDLVRLMNQDLAMLEGRIRKMAVNRDRFRADRVKDVRGAWRPYLPYRIGRFP
jgi:hypothetical protein